VAFFISGLTVLACAAQNCFFSNLERHHRIASTQLAAAWMAGDYRRHAPVGVAGLETAGEAAGAGWQAARADHLHPDAV
jgi:hypothetical protein